MHSSMKRPDLIRWYLRGWSPWQHRWVRRGLLMGVYGRTRGRLPSEGGGCHAARRGSLVGFCRVWSEEPLFPRLMMRRRAPASSAGERGGRRQRADWRVWPAGRWAGWLSLSPPPPCTGRPHPCDRAERPGVRLSVPAVCCTPGRTPLPPHHHLPL